MEIGERLSAALEELAAAMDRQTVWDREKLAIHERARQDNIERAAVRDAGDMEKQQAALAAAAEQIAILQRLLEIVEERFQPVPRTPLPGPERTHA